MEKVRPAFPYRSVWYRPETCELRLIRPKDQWVRDRLANAGVELSQGVWAFVYSGRVEEYSPVAAALQDCLALCVHHETSDKPVDGWLDFFQRWGPLGLANLQVTEFRLNRQGTAWIGKLKQERDLYRDVTTVSYEEHWRLFHRHSLKTPTWFQKKYPGKPYLPLTVDEELQAYVEYWPLAHERLMDLFTAVELRQSDMTGPLHALFQQNIAMGLTPYSYVYNSLFGALVSIAVDQFLEGQRFLRCPPPCNKFFPTEHASQVYCSKTCRERFHRLKADKKRSDDEVEREKHRIRAKLGRRHDLIQSMDLDEEKIRAELNQVGQDRDKLNRFK